TLPNTFFKQTATATATVTAPDTATTYCLLLRVAKHIVCKLIGNGVVVMGSYSLTVVSIKEVFANFHRHSRFIPNHNDSD
ncbi:hypothetical protein Tco_0301633, partial [Tanacetum coccineum]